MIGNNPKAEVIGIIPAGGLATRLSPLPLSKEIYPVGFQTIKGRDGLRPKVVSQYLLEKMRRAGIKKVFIVLRKGKWDIPAYLSHGEMVGLDLAYLIMKHPFGTPFTLDQAYPFVKNAIVALGFPDIIFDKDDAFEQILNRLSESKADIVLGLFPIDRPEKWDMVDFGETGEIRKLFIKSKNHRLRYGWVIAVWSPVFSKFMHSYLKSIKFKYKLNDDGDHVALPKEFHFGDVIQEAIHTKLAVDSVTFFNGNCIDIGTPTDMARAIGNINQFSHIE